MSRRYNGEFLKEEAQKWLDENVITTASSTCPTCGCVTPPKKRIVSEKHEDLFYGDGPNLPTYELKNDDEVDVILQASPWSSGPYAFLCLELKGKKMFEWTEKEMTLIG